MKNKIHAISKQFYSDIYHTIYGFRLWRRCLQDFRDYQNCVFVLIPRDYSVDNFYALLYMDQMLDRNEYSEAVILSTDPDIQKYSGFFSNNILETRIITSFQSECLLKFYMLKNLGRRLIVASLDKPEGRCTTALLGQRGITREELFAICVYRIHDFIRPIYPSIDWRLQREVENAPDI